MNKNLREKLITIAKEKINPEDVSHDFNHAFRTLLLAEKIAKKEKADLDIVVPAALFHDVIVYPKNDPRSMGAEDESAKCVGEILRDIKEYSAKKIEKVQTAIRQCSFLKKIKPELLEARILQDADRLEATGAISIMRTFASTGQMKRMFYQVEDPFCQNREADPNHYALDLFYHRLLKVGEGMNTKTARKMAKRRTKFLYSFLKELKLELKGK
jgi:uncharacterized protein